jgi:HAMP domain-containing protein|tara:strand:- start:1435 stop:1677 length:243 start_codon:yes stop_codon:yes gene_type:complete
MDVVETLKKYAVLVGIVTTLGGGFYAWGVFNNRLDELEQSTSSKKIKELNKKVNIQDKRLEVLETRFNEFKVTVQNPLKY